MNTLTITNPDAQTLVSVQIGEIDPAEATVAILSALKTIQPKRRPRSDKGSSRKPTT